MQQCNVFPCPKPFQSPAVKHLVDYLLKNLNLVQGFLIHALLFEILFPFKESFLQLVVSFHQQSSHYSLGSRCLDLRKRLLGELTCWLLKRILIKDLSIEDSRLSCKELGVELLCMAYFTYMQRIVRL